MGKRLIQQRRGRGTPRYEASSHRWKGEAKHRSKLDEAEGEIIDIVKCRGHTAPLAKVKYGDGEQKFTIAVEGQKVGDKITSGKQKIKPGHTAKLESIPEGTKVCNIESQPGDGGKFARSSGTFAKVTGKTDEGVVIQLPSKTEKTFSPNCRATIGEVAGGGRTEKPFLKGGTKFHNSKPHRIWPKVKGSSMNAVDHPFGGTRSSHQGKHKIAPKNAPAGRKVGKRKPKRTGKEK